MLSCDQVPIFFLETQKKEKKNTDQVGEQIMEESMGGSEAGTAAASPINPAVSFFFFFFGERERRRLLFFEREREAASMDSISSNCDLGQFCDPGRIGIFLFLYLKKIKFQNYMAVSKNFKTIPLSPRTGGLSPSGWATGPKCKKKITFRSWHPGRIK